MQKSNICFFLLLITLVITISGGSIVKKIAGADIDAEQFAKAREAKMLEMRYKSSARQVKLLQGTSPLDNSDFVINLQEDVLNRIVKQYDSTSGWLDGQTSFTVKDAKLTLENGAALVSIIMDAYNQKHDVTVALTMDCILSFDMVNNELFLRLEPYNIAPTVTTTGLLSSADEIISNLIKINLGNISQSFPNLKIPLNFSNTLTIPGSKTDIKSQINLQILNPNRAITYKLALKDILIFKKVMVIALNVDKVEVK